MLKDNYVGTLSQKLCKDKYRCFQYKELRGKLILVLRWTNKQGVCDTETLNVNQEQILIHVVEYPPLRIVILLNWGHVSRLQNKPEDAIISKISKSMEIKADTGYIVGRFIVVIDYSYIWIVILFCVN